MRVCKNCSSKMIGVVSFKNGNQEKFCRCPKCGSETVHMIAKK